MYRLEALRKVLDAARLALAGVVGVLAVIAEQADVLGLPPGVKAAIIGAVAWLGQMGIRRKTTPHADPDISQVPELVDTPELAEVTGRPVGELPPPGAVAPPRGEEQEPVSDPPWNPESVIEDVIDELRARGLLSEPDGGTPG